ncbi:hypothetical protein [Haloarchaeobius sp. HRN-SO-5]|uniref:hypothetical protein n=1 Tax=Haloarchaeobius sp. HRN-SO-5 TaxID=3446118 RepID=UPI003EC03515
MRGPFHALWNTRLVGAYFRMEVVLLLASVLAVVGAIVALGIGGVLGILVLAGLVLAGLVVLGVVAATR